MQSVCGLCFSVISIIIIMKVKTVEKRRDLLYDHDNDQEAHLKEVEVISHDDRDALRYGIVVPIDKNRHLSDKFATDFRHWNYMPKEGEAIIELPAPKRPHDILEFKEIVDRFITENKVTS